jgi:6-pyruvoyltetrahydropterin/6-carboxytetrahydropterin synthase
MLPRSPGAGYGGGMSVTWTAVRRSYRFCASHRLFRPEWDDARNLEVFGPASHAPGHGHNYRLVLTIHGRPDGTTGRVVDVALLDRVVDQEVVRVFDHRNVNRDVPSLAWEVPTAERMAEDIFERLESRIPSGLLVQVELQQDELFSAVCGIPWPGSGPAV